MRWKLLRICKKTIVTDFEAILKLLWSGLFWCLLTSGVSDRLAVRSPLVLLHTGRRSRQLLGVTAHHGHSKKLWLVVRVMC
jgi:hypothetical protein